MINEKEIPKILTELIDYAQGQDVRLPLRIMRTGKSRKPILAGVRDRTKFEVRDELIECLEDLLRLFAIPNLREKNLRKELDEIENRIKKAFKDIAKDETVQEIWWIITSHYLDKSFSGHVWKSAYFYTFGREYYKQILSKLEEEQEREEFSLLEHPSFKKRETKDITF